MLGCGGVFPPGEEPLFLTSPADGEIELGNPAPPYGADVFVEACHLPGEFTPLATGEGDLYRYSLIDPGGQVVATGQGVSVGLNLPDGAQDGDYLLVMDWPGGHLERKLSAYYYPGPQMMLVDTDGGRLEKRSRVEYAVPATTGRVTAFVGGFAPRDLLDARFYKDLSSGDYRLLNTWTYRAEDNGLAAITLDLAAAPAGEYLLTVCAQRDCATTYGNPLTGSEITPPPTAFVRFTRESASPAPWASQFRVCTGACATTDALKWGESLPERTTTAYATFDYENIPRGAHYTRIWRHAGRGEWIRYECDWPGPSSGTQELRLREPRGLHSGIWEVEVQVDGFPILVEQVLVDGSHTYWDPVGAVNGCPS